MQGRGKEEGRGGGGGVGCGVLVLMFQVASCLEIISKRGPSGPRGSCSPFAYIAIIDTNTYGHFTIISKNNVG